jgi:hypothetical protein
VSEVSVRQKGQANIQLFGGLEDEVLIFPACGGCYLPKASGRRHFKAIGKREEPIAHQPGLIQRHISGLSPLDSQPNSLYATRLSSGSRYQLPLRYNHNRIGIHLAQKPFGPT